MIVFHDDAWADYLYWLQHDKAMLKRVNALIKDIQRSPFVGIGKPEPLKHLGGGFWSRRTNDEHRLVYRFSDNELIIVQCRLHYR